MKKITILMILFGVLLADTAPPTDPVCKRRLSIMVMVIPPTF